MKKCENCEIEAVVIVLDTIGEGLSEVCLNCGYYIQSNKLDDEELENIRENYEEEVEELKEKGIKLEVIE